MTYSNAAVAYREREVLTASPAQLVVIVYDHLLVNLRRARMAHDARNNEVRVESIAKAREAISELLVTLDVERGGEMAQGLRSLYAFVLSELVDAGMRHDAARLDRITKMVSELRDAFATLVGGQSSGAPTSSSAA
jgi:flagellar protein FliS